MATTPQAADASEHQEPSTVSQSLSIIDDTKKSVAPSANSSEAITPVELAQPTADSVEPDPEAKPEEDAGSHTYGWRFYTIFGALVAATLLSALDGAIVAVALPTISSSLDTGPDYVWVANVYFLTG